MSIRQAYSDWAATYDVDRNLTRDLDQAVTRNILANLHCKSVLELGCGTGKNTALLAEIGERVRAVDFSPSMIERAKDKLRLNNVSFEVADITEPWPCASDSYDLIVCNLVLEHIRDSLSSSRKRFVSWLLKDDSSFANCIPLDSTRVSKRVSYGMGK